MTSAFITANGSHPHARTRREILDVSWGPQIGEDSYSSFYCLLSFSNKLVPYELLSPALFSLVLGCPQVRSSLCSIHARDVLEHLRLIHLMLRELVADEILNVLNQLHIILHSRTSHREGRLTAGSRI